MSLPAEIVVFEILPKLSLEDILSLRMVNKYYKFVLSDGEIVRQFRSRAFFGSGKLVWNTLKGTGYSRPNLYKFLPGLTFRDVLAFIRKRNLDRALELETEYDSCHFFKPPDRIIFPNLFFRNGSEIVHSDGRTLVYIGDKRRTLEEQRVRFLSEKEISPERFFLRWIVPYFIGITREDAIDYLHDQEEDVPTIPIELTDEDRISFPTVIRNKFWALTYPSSKLKGKWNFALEKFQKKKFLGVTAIGASRRSGEIISGTLLFAGEDTTEIGRCIARVMHYTECSVIKHYDLGVRTPISIKVSDSVKGSPICT